MPASFSQLPDEFVSDFFMEWCTTPMIAKVDTAFCTEVDRPWLLNLLQTVIVRDGILSQIKASSFGWCMNRRMKFNSICIAPTFLNDKHELKKHIDVSSIKSILFFPVPEERKKLESQESRKLLNQMMPGMDVLPFFGLPQEVLYEKPTDENSNDDDIIAFVHSCKNVNNLQFDNYHSFKDTTLNRIDSKVLGKLTHLKIEDKCVDFKEILRTIGEKGKNLQHLTLVSDSVQTTDLVECLKLLPRLHYLELGCSLVNCVTVLELIPTLDLYNTLERLILSAYTISSTIASYESIANFIQSNAQIKTIQLEKIVKAERNDDSSFVLEVTIPDDFHHQGIGSQKAKVFKLFDIIKDVNGVFLTAPSCFTIMSNYADSYIPKVVSHYCSTLMAFSYSDSGFSPDLKNNHIELLLSRCPKLEVLALNGADKLINKDFHKLGEWNPKLTSLAITVNNSITTKTIIKLMNNKKSNIRSFTLLKCNIVDCDAVNEHVKLLNSRMKKATDRPFTLKFLHGSGYKEKGGCCIM